MLCVRLLGGFQARLDEHPLAGFRSNKARLLLAYLMLYRRRAHPRLSLANLFWPDRDESHGLANLRKLLYWLRRAFADRLESYVLVEGSTLRFNPESDYALDVEEFEQLLESARLAPEGERTEPLSRAVELYRGDLLAGFYDDWLLLEQERLEQFYVQALKDLMAHCVGRGDYPQAIAWGRSALEADPFQEEVHRSLMRLYALAGDRTKALKQYSRCASALRELALSPLPETRALFEKLLQGVPLSPTPQPAVRLPRMPFVGRQRERTRLADLWRRVHRGRGRAVIVAGEAGVGKTRLVQTALARRAQGGRVLQGEAHALGRELPYHPLLQTVRQGLEHLSTLAPLPAPWQSELSRFVPQLGQGEADPDPPPAQGKARWFAALTGFYKLLARERPVVLFLDDLHWADEGTLAYLSYLLPQLKGLPLLLVGTYRLEEAGEGTPLRAWLDALGPGRSYRALTLEPLTREETAQLLEKLLQAPAAEVSRTLYDETGGNPLFLRELLRSLTRSGALRPDAQGRWALTTGEISTAQFSESLHGLIGASLRRAPQRSRVVLGLAAVVGRRVEFPVLQEVLHLPEEELVDRLDELCRAGLLVERAGTYRFHHELVRQFVYETLSLDRKRLWHRRVGGALEACYPDRLDELSGEVARHFQRARSEGRAATYLVRAGTWARRSYAPEEAQKFFGEARELFERLEEERPLSRRLKRTKLELLDGFIRLFPTIYDIRDSLDELEGAIFEMGSLARALGDRAWLCQAHQHRAGLALARGQSRLARRTLQEALELSQGVPDPAARAKVLQNLGNLHAQLNEYEPALGCYQRAAAAWTSVGNATRQGSLLEMTAFIHFSLGQLAQAQQNLKRALKLLEGTKNAGGQFAVHNTWGLVLHELGRWQSAQEAYERALGFAGQTSPRNLGAVLINLGTLQNDQERYDDALGYLERALALLGGVGTQGLEIEALIERGRTHLGQGEPQRALARSSRAMERLESQQGVLFQAQRFYFRHAQILQANRKGQEAKRYLHRAHREVQRAAERLQKKPLRAVFLKNVRINREILRAWEAMAG